MQVNQIMLLTMCPTAGTPNQPQLQTTSRVEPPPIRLIAPQTMFDRLRAQRIEVQDLQHTTRPLRDFTTEHLNLLALHTIRELNYRGYRGN